MTNKKRTLVFISVLLAMFISAVEATIVTTAMPSIAADLGNFSRYSWIFSSYLLMSTVSVLVYGKLADLYGRKPIFLIGVTIFLIGSFGAGFSTTMEILIVFRFIQGLGAGAVAPMATTIVGDLYSLEERAKVQGYMSSVWGISAILGPAIGGMIVEYASWQMIFWINIPIGLLSMVGVYLYLEEDDVRKKVSIDYRGIFYSSVFLIALIIWLTEGGQSFPYFSIVGWLLLVVVSISFIFFIQAQKSSTEPMLSLDVWKRPTIFYANIVTFVTGMILIAISSYLPPFVTGVMGEKPIIAGFALTAMSIGWPIASTISGHLLLRFGPFLVSLAGGFSLIIGASILLSLTSDVTPLLAAIASFFIGVGMGLTSTAFIVSIQQAVPYEQRGEATASNMFMRNFGNTLGAAFFGALLNRSLQKSVDGTTLTVDDMNVLFSEDALSKLSFEVLHQMQPMLEQALHYVYLGILGLAILATLLILKIPKGKVVVHDSNRT